MALRARSANTLADGFIPLVARALSATLPTKISVRSAAGRHSSDGVGAPATSAVADVSARLVGRTLRVIVRLVERQHGATLVAQRIDVPLEQVVVAAWRVAVMVAKALDRPAPPELAKGLDRPEIAGAYLEAARRLHMDDPEANDSAIELLERTLRRAPDDPYLQAAYTEARA